jgi:hypothetical protein
MWAYLFEVSAIYRATLSVKMDYEHNVFINCPFDDAYSSLLRAIVFAVLDCGFHPRCALESPDASENRIQRIYRIISDCGLGIHDLSRNQPDPDTKLPRFNMPLELGIFLGAKFLGHGEQLKKLCLIFDEHPYVYQKYLSDVAGQDINWHRNDPKIAVFSVRNWLGSLTQGHIPSGSIVWDHYRTFQGELRQTCIELKQKPDELTYIDMRRHIIAFRDGYVEELTIKGDNKISDPTDYEIRSSINSVGFADVNPFIVLGKGRNGYTFVQAWRLTNLKWTVEYQQGDIDQHFKATTNVKTEELIQLFIAYAHSEEEWGSDLEWKLIDV